MTNRTLHLQTNDPSFPHDWCVGDIITNPDGSLTALNATRGACAVVPPIIVPPNSLRRLLVSDMRYGPYEAAIRRNVDLTKMDAIFGHRNATDAVVPWYLNTGAAPCILGFSRDVYIAAEFTTPSTPIPFGAINLPRNRLGQPPSPGFDMVAACGLDIAFSLLPGDFTPNGGMTKFNATPDDNDVIHYGPRGNPQDNAILLPSTRYFYSIRAHFRDGPTFPAYQVRT